MKKENTKRAFLYWKRKKIYLSIALLIIAVIPTTIFVTIYFLKKNKVAKPVISIHTNLSDDNLKSVTKNTKEAIEYKKRFEQENNGDKIFLLSLSVIKNFRDAFIRIFDRHITDDIQTFEKNGYTGTYSEELIFLLDCQKIIDDKSFKLIGKLWNTIEITQLELISPIEIYKKDDKDRVPAYFNNKNIKSIRKNFLSIKMAFLIVNESFKSIEGLKHVVFYKYANLISKILQNLPDILIEDKSITKQEFNEWQSIRSNRLNFLIYDRTLALTTGLPLLIIYLFVREEKVKEMYESGTISLSKTLEAELIIMAVMQRENLDDDKWDENLMMGDCYRLFSLVQERSKEDKNYEKDKVILKLIETLDGYFRSFIESMKKFDN